VAELATKLPQLQVVVSCLVSFSLLTALSKEACVAAVNEDADWPLDNGRLTSKETTALALSRRDSNESVSLRVGEQLRTTKRPQLLAETPVTLFPTE